MKIPRALQNLGVYLKPNKVLVLYGPRQVGKTTLVQDFLATTPLKYKLDLGDDVLVQEALGSRVVAKIREYVGKNELVVIDEAQKIPHVGDALKIIVDQVPNIRIIATGSSTFELSGQVGEPLTGRKVTLTLYPVSQIELKALHGIYEVKQKLEEYLVYGGYPEVVATGTVEEKKRILSEITGSYLLKDILELEKVKNSKIVLDMLRLLAFQVGSEVSLSEIAQQLGIDYKTVARYLDLLEKTFVLYNLRGLSRNLRNEVTKKSKYYFFDNGIRNAVISNFNSLALRDDVGRLWENFLVIERVKKQAYQQIYANNYFWRTWSQKEIDFIEETGGRLFGYEFAWGQKKVRPPKEWIAAYPNAEFQVITRDNYLEFVT